MPPPLSIVHQRQLRDGFCLSACVQMVLQHMGIQRDQTSIARQMGLVEDVGVPLSRVTRLASVDVRVAIERESTFVRLEQVLASGLAPIAFVRTGELPYWQVDAAHAVVVIGSDSEQVTLLDPAMDASPRRLDHATFQLAWDGLDSTFAVLERVRV